MSPIFKTLPLMLLALSGAGCNRNTAAGNDRAADVSEPPRIAEPAAVETAVSEADRNAIYPHTMLSAEYEPVVGADPKCQFQLTAVGMPILVAEGRTGAVKINGKIVSLESPGANPEEGLNITMSAGDIEVVVVPLEEEGDTLDNGLHKREADFLFNVKEGRSAGYRGYYLCRA